MSDSHMKPVLERSRYLAVAQITGSFIMYLTSIFVSFVILCLGIHSSPF